jgi:7-carboxy-7-deazaguanine synthase
MNVLDQNLAKNVTQVTYPVVETFHSFQGEGAWAGASAFFIRLGGCDVHCWFCDTKESWNEANHPHISLDQICSAATLANPAIAVITGGEPLMHNLFPLTAALHQQNLRVHLETSGAHPFSGDFDWVTLSPKKFKPPHPTAYVQVQELKVVVADRSDLDWAEAQAARLPANTLKYLQPEWNTSSSESQIFDLIFDYIVQHPTWRIGLQTHKFMGVR